ncbi:related to ketoreductase [Cephalotrichum gorgonifer]|uniref:Related to ketoreductase n=1 Tax=Cephalotrichum gorgonifer TaxID=2041049 RepID=A0AAE8SSX7_9PEZI|nr:related to ketoreductase [Cephalotrichum gorgonifer]
MSQTFVLITGANRGLGRGLLERFLAQPNHTVIAANRDPTHPTSKSLSELPKGQDSSLIVVRYDAAAEQDASNVVDELKEKHGIDRLDIVIPNAGISKQHPLVKDAKRADMLEHVQVNVYAMISLYQATRDLLQKSTREPIFAPISSIAGSVTNQPPIQNACYGASKCLLNWYGIRINAEDEWLNTFVLDPGFSSTDMGIHAARTFGYPDEVLISPDDAVDGMFEVFQTASKEEHGGRLVSYTGEIQEW